MSYICPTHDKEFKGPNTKGNYWHVVNFDKGEFCNMTQAEVENDTKMNQVAQAHTQIKQRIAEDEIKGQIRTHLVRAVIQHDGLHALSMEEKEIIEQNVNYIYNGK